MFIDFKNISDNSRLWIYGSAKVLTSDIQISISKKIISFLNSWVHHGNSLTCSFTILHERFIVIALDEDINQTGGCSMDGLQKLILKIDEDFCLDLYNRLNVFINAKNKITCINSNMLKTNYDITEDSLFFDLNISKKKDLSSWLIPIKKGWCKRFLD
ncbi:hypothetical protein N9Q36_02390 [Flavobacteriales bacterium]|nr:hypothetical protein [Flavobacteriales bacterium]